MTICRKPTNQTDRVYNHLCLVGPLTSVVALRELGVSRLASRVCELRNEEIEIEDRWIRFTNKYGEVVRVKEYFIT